MSKITSHPLTSSHKHRSPSPPRPLPKQGAITPDYYIGGQRPELTRFSLDLHSGLVGVTKLSERVCEFPCVNPGVVGKRHRFAFVAASAVDHPVHWGPNHCIVKVRTRGVAGRCLRCVLTGDIFFFLGRKLVRERLCRVERSEGFCLLTIRFSSFLSIRALSSQAPSHLPFSSLSSSPPKKTPPSPTQYDFAGVRPDAKPSAANPSGRPSVDLWYAGPHRFPQEPIFVPKAGATGKREDAGYLLTLVYDGETETTDLVILDGENISGGPVATVKLDHHIPFGLHGSWSPNVHVDL